jgi:zinc transporter, ZIP family
VVAGEGERMAAAGGEKRGLGPRFWIFGLLPLVLLAGLLAFFAIVGPAGVFEAAFPPVEELTIERIYFDEVGIGVQVVNGGPETVTIAQVTVDEALWQFEVEPDAELGRLDRATVRIPYPWSEGEPHAVVLISSSGVAFEKVAEVATATPKIGGRYLGTFTLLGLYVGVIPVLIGLLWFPFLRRLSERWLNFFLSFTVGLLLFLGIDTVEASLELATEVAAAFQGVALAVGGALVAFLAVAAVDRAMAPRAGDTAKSTLVLVYSIAVGIGLHNLGEGLAIGAAYAGGSIALGTMLVVGFAAHNTTEGLAIAAPLARMSGKVSRLVPHLLAAGVIGGVPAIAGAWLGGFAFSPVWTTVFLAVGAGAIFQVVWQIGRLMGNGDDGTIFAPLNAAGVVVGMLVMYATGLLVTG